MLILAIIIPRWTEEMEQKLHQGDESPDSNTENLEDEVKVVQTIVNDTVGLITAGMESIIEDEVTSRFKAAQLQSWNFLTRNRHNYIYIKWVSAFVHVMHSTLANIIMFSWKLTIIWIIGLVYR